MSKTAIYPGTFDPVTNGHLDLIRRGVALFDNLIIAVAHNPGKNPLFSVEERVAFISRATAGFPNIKVMDFNNLLIDFVKKNKGDVIVKGLRAVSDFEYELQLSAMNRRLDNNIETVFMMPSEEYSFLSSRIIKEIASLGGDVESMVTKEVFKALKGKFGL
jgi:pantetheine-phosphate adenylyltransferase